MATLTALGLVTPESSAVLAAPRWQPNANSFLDSDNDMLPDSVEHVLLLDPDSPDSDDDGTADFIHAAMNRTVFLDGSRDPAPIPQDHGVRVLVTVEDEDLGAGQSTKGAWLHILVRVVGGDLSTIQTLEPFLDHWGTEVALLPLLQFGPIDVASGTATSGDLLVRASMRMMSERELLALAPCTIGARSVVGGQASVSGSYIQFIDGAACSLVDVGSGSSVLQLLRRPLIDDPFWTTNRVCMLRLALVGTTSGGIYAEVVRADCVTGRTTTACPPTCTTSVGRLVFFPDGLRTVTSGGN